MVVGLRDRPAPVRQVRRRAAKQSVASTPAARVHRRRRLPHPQPESRAGHERLDAGRLQSRMEAGVGAARAQCAPQPAAHLFGGTPGHRQGADRLRSRMGQDVQLAAKSTPTAKASIRPRCSAISSSTAATPRAPRRSTRRRSSPAKPTPSASGQGLAIGMRFHSAPVIRLADAKPVHLGHAVKADGRWRIFAFAGRGGSRRAELRHPRAVRLSCRVAEVAGARNTRPTARTSTAVIDVRAVFQQGHRDARPSRPCRPSCCRAKGRYGLRDYEKMFCPDLKSGNDIFDMRGIDRERGCMVIVRPDQYVAHVLPLDGYAAARGILRWLHDATELKAASRTQPANPRVETLCRRPCRNAHVTVEQLNHATAR